jgi:hypothetical protein
MTPSAAPEIRDQPVISAAPDTTPVPQTLTAVPGRPERNEISEPWNDIAHAVTSDNILEGTSRRAKGKAKETISQAFVDTKSWNKKPRPG